MHALRRDGFDGEIALALKDAPPGFTLSGDRLPAGQDLVRLTLSVPAESQAEPYVLSLVGQATIQQRQVTHAAVAADDLMQAFIYRHLVPASQLEVCITGSPHRFTIGTAVAEPIKIPPGGKVRVPVNRAHQHLPRRGPPGTERSAAGNHHRERLAGATGRRDRRSERCRRRQARPEGKPHRQRLRGANGRRRRQRKGSANKVAHPAELRCPPFRLKSLRTRSRARSTVAHRGGRGASRAGLPLPSARGHDHARGAAVDRRLSVSLHPAGQNVTGVLPSNPRRINSSLSRNSWDRTIFCERRRRANLRRSHRAA